MSQPDTFHSKDLTDRTRSATDNGINSTLSLLSWNVNGWYHNTKQIRESVIVGINPDIGIIGETHLKDDEKVFINDYHCISHNRKVRHLRAKKNYGGVCILIKKHLDRYYSYTTVDKEHDGILAVKFRSKSSDYCFLVVALYLPPEQTTWGRDAAGFYSHMLKLMYEYSYCDHVVLAGDVNSKMGSVQDFIPEIDDNIGKRKILDKNKNKHGQELIDFLIESKMCVCNGRVTPEFDNYTFIHTRGKSVIDYFMIPIESLCNCVEFKGTPSIPETYLSSSVAWGLNLRVG